MQSKAKKIYINKNEEAAAVIERIIDAESAELVLSIPKFARFSQSESNFHLLRKEADTLSKQISIESVDEKVLELAANSDIPASNPFFANPDKQFSDIIPKARNEMSGEAVFVKATTLPKPKVSAVKKEEEYDDSDDDAGISDEIGAAIESQFGPAKPRTYSLNIWLAVLSFLMVAGGATFVAVRVLPSASVYVTAIKKDFIFDSVINVDKNIRENDLAMMKVPGQIFSEKRNATLTFPSSGKKFVSRKAEGKITVYNGYSSEPQKLVASTRFITPDEKVFRLVNAVVVPGAKIIDGKIVASSVEVAVIADKAGEEYNISPISRFEIPGFKGTARYGAFYADSVTPMSGGYVGEQAYPNEEDIKKGKAEIARVLEDGARAALQSKIPNDFKMVENAFVFSIDKQTVNTDVNAAGQFSIFAEANMSLMAFRSVDAENILRSKALRDGGANFIVKSDELNYGSSMVDMAAGKMTVGVDYKAILAHNIDVEDLHSKVLGKSESELQDMLATIAGLDGGKIELWPFWVKSVPSRSSKVDIIVN